MKQFKEKYQLHKNVLFTVKLGAWAVIRNLKSLYFIEYSSRFPLENCTSERSPKNAAQPQFFSRGCAYVGSSDVLCASVCVLWRSTPTPEKDTGRLVTVQIRQQSLAACLYSGVELWLDGTYFVQWQCRINAAKNCKLRENLRLIAQLMKNTVVYIGNI